MFDPATPFNDLPPLPPKANLETSAILKAVTRASRSLGELKGMSGASGRLPNPRILIQALVLQEAKGSSEIEGIVTTHDNLYKALAVSRDSEQDPKAKEVLRYREALDAGLRSIRSGRPLCVTLYEQLVKIIKLTDGGVRKIPGTQLRTEKTDELIYTPPEGEGVLRDKLANFDRFVNDDLSPELDPLIKMAVAHYQFEAIHPFHDGNGRVGRLINVLYLIQRGLLDEPVLYLSGQLYRTRVDYYRLLGEVTSRGAWEPWVLYILDSIHQTALETLGQIKAILDCMESFSENAKAKCDRAHSKELVELLFERPYCKINFLIDRGLGSRPTVTGYLSELVESGLLQIVKVGRENFYINVPFLKVLKQPK